MIDLEWSAWLPEGDPGLEVLVPDSQAGGGDFEPTFESLKVGLTRRTSRSNALNHGIPFFPKSAQSVETITIKSVSKDKICLVNEATLDMLGVITIVDICLESKESETTMKIYAKAIFSGNGKYSVPKSLAEKPTIDGVKAYYSELCVWLNEHISLQPTPSIRYSHHHFEKDEFKPVHESILPFSIDTLWNEWFNIPGTGNTFTNYLLGPEKVQNLEIGPWVLNNPTEMDKLLPLGHRENGMYHPDLTSLQEGYERKTTRNNPLNHGLPFIPKTAQNIESFKIIHRDDDTLCVFTDAHLPVMGIITQCHVCLVQLSPSQTQLKAYMKVIFTGKGKYPVPKALAEKSAIEGVALFYQNLTQYFIDSIVESPLGAEQMCECVQLEKDGYKTVLETEIHVPIAVLWLETFAVSSQPNTFSTTFTVTGAAKWTELEYSKFVKKEEQDAPLVPLSQCSDPQYRMAFKDLQVGMKRKAQYLVPLKHGIPFVPKTMLNTSNDHVHDVTPHRVCFHSEAFVADVGVSTLLRICYTACTSTRTRVHVQTKIVCGKGKYPVPKGNTLHFSTIALAEKSGYETVTSLYDELYKICNQTLAGPDQPQSKPKSETKPIVVTPTQTFTQWTRTLPREYLVLSIVILMVLMFMNCIILWFLFLVTERTNQRLDVIVAVIKTLKAELNQ
ncbi:hypothetical protein BC833DRAFT_268101 [Globomyces pollinis-pini]|nr:hypothetical protein BC833DRAFT_268101 [Globomyces pollinis-pini]